MAQYNSNEVVDRQEKDLAVMSNKRMVVRDTSKWNYSSSYVSTGLPSYAANRQLVSMSNNYIKIAFITPVH